MHPLLQVLPERQLPSEKKPANGFRQSVANLWRLRLDIAAKKMRGRPMTGKAVVGLCLACLFVGTLFSNRAWTRPLQGNGVRGISNNNEMKMVTHMQLQDCDHQRKLVDERPGDVMEQVTRTHQAIESLDKTISSLEMELAVARTKRPSKSSSRTLEKAFIVIGINTAFSSKKRRQSIRDTWMPRGGKLRKLEKEKGIVIRFVIGHSATAGGVLDRAIDAEESKTKDFLRLDHVEGYNQLSSKTRIYFSTVVALWDADFYLKVDDDVHVNLGTLATTLARYRSKPRTYIGCMKSGPVLSQKGVKYHEPEFWKFGEEGNKYFRHATGQIYAISKDLATYISINEGILHKYANEDVSLGSWLIGLEVNHVDEHSMCCGTPPDCEWKTQAGSVCVASFDWSCSGICQSVERMKGVHNACGEGEEAVWNLHL